MSPTRLVARLLVTAAVLVGTGAPASPASAAGLPRPNTPVPCRPVPATGGDVGGQRLGEAGLQTALPAGVPSTPRLAASSFLVVDLTTGDVLAACNAHLPLRPASTLKILTALALVERLDPAARFTATPLEANVEGSKVGLYPGSTYSTVDLLHGLMLDSGNDAAQAFATLSGGMPAATELMNAEARRLGADDTRAVNTSGLDADGQVTSAYDLALIGREALRRPWLRGVVGTRTYAFPNKGAAADASRPRYQIQNNNRLLANYPGAIGVKNGYTSLSSGTFVGAATRGDRSYLVTVMQSGTEVSRMAGQLLDWAFANGSRAEPVGRLVGALPGAPQDPEPTGPVASQPAAPVEPAPTGQASVGATAAPSGASPSPAEPGTDGAAATTLPAEPVGAEVPRVVALGYIALAVVVGLGLGLVRVASKNRADRRARARAVAREQWSDLTGRDRAGGAGDDVSAGRPAGPGPRR